MFLWNLNPKHDQNFMEQNFKRFKFYIRIHTRINHTCTNRWYIQVSTQHFWPQKHRKSTHKTITQFLCLIFKDIKDLRTHITIYSKNTWCRGWTLKPFCRFWRFTTIYCTLCKIVYSDWLRDIWLKSISSAESWNHALTHDRTWKRVISLDDGWYSKKNRLRRIYARTVHHRFWLASYERLKIYGVRNTKSNIHLTWIVLKPNVM